MTKLNCLIVDDEPLAREGLAGYVNAVEFLSLADTCENPVLLPQLLNKYHVDLIFLDIQMPFINGIDFLKASTQLPMIILTTAYPNYAIEGFQLNVLDYLLKPITFERFFQAATKSRDYHALKTAGANDLIEAKASYFFIRCGNTYEKIIIDEIQYIEGLQNYVTIFTTKGKYITLLSLKQLEENLAGRPFLRVHKSYIVSILQIERIEHSEIFIGAAHIPIGKSYRDQVMEQIIDRKLWERK